ncbi:MAG: hypothetical protein QM757_47240 [Paludibaculum sp.]
MDVHLQPPPAAPAAEQSENSEARRARAQLHPAEVGQAHQDDTSGEGGRGRDRRVFHLRE